LKLVDPRRMYSVLHHCRFLRQSILSYMMSRLTNRSLVVDTGQPQPQSGYAHRTQLLWNIRLTVASVFCTALCTYSTALCVNAEVRGMKKHGYSTFSWKWQVQCRVKLVHCSWSAGCYIQYSEQDHCTKCTTRTISCQEEAWGLFNMDLEKNEVSKWEGWDDKSRCTAKRQWNQKYLGYHKVLETQLARMWS